MKVEYYKEFSHELNRDMEFKVFGHAGKPCLVFPPQDGRFYDYENFGMIEAAREYIDAGKIQMFCCDSIDAETFSKQDGDPKERSALQERWFQYIVNELVPRIYQISQYEHTETKGIIATGCSMGGYHATNAFLRRSFKIIRMNCCIIIHRLIILPICLRIILIWSYIARLKSYSAAGAVHGNRIWLIPCIKWKQS